MLQPVRPSASSAATITICNNLTADADSKRRRRAIKPSGAKNNTASTTPAVSLPGIGVNLPMTAEVVETVRVVVCALLLAAENVSVGEENPQEADEGNDPQLSVRMPANPFAGVNVSSVLPVVPCVIVNVAGAAERLMLGTSAVMVTICAAEVEPAKALSPL